jgi:hypothetical protein
MNRKFGYKFAMVFSIMLAVLSTMVIPVEAQRRRARARAAAPATYTVLSGTSIRVRIDEELSSEDARIGDTFTSTVVDPVYANGIEVIPQGSKIGGRVIAVQKAGRRSKAGTISVTFNRLTLPTGRAYAINGSLTDVSGETVNYDEEGQVQGKSSTKRNVVFIGGGAATGAAIGAIAGGGKGAGIGAGIGAGLGVAGSLLSKGKEAKVKRDTEFGVLLNRAIRLPRFR